MSEPDRSPGSAPLPSTRRRRALVVCVLSACVIAVTAWAALLPTVETAQTRLVLWWNDPPQPISSLMAVVNPLLRPVPLAILAFLLLGWVLLASPDRRRRLEVVRSAVLAFLLAELMAQALKRLVDQPRPLSVIPGLDDHGYPTDPRGNAYPSAHTAVVVALVCALWPWMNRSQRVVGLVIAVLVGCHRLYIGAHWPLDVVGGAAIGLFTGAVTWLVATRWPIRD